MAIDWNELWGILSSASSAVSAIAAAVAVWLVVQQNRDNELNRRLQKREKYYESWVAIPIHDAIKNFRIKVLDLARSFALDSEPLRSMDSQQLLMRRAVGRLVEDINAEYYQLQDAVLGGVEAWDNEALREHLREKLELLQDETTTSAEMLLSDPSHNISVVLEKNCPPILRLVLEGDPGADRRIRP